MGLVTISISGTPARFTSSSEVVAPWIRPVSLPTWVSLPVEHGLFGLDGMRRHLQGGGLQVILLRCGDIVHGHLE